MNIYPAKVKTRGQNKGGTEMVRNLTLFVILMIETDSINQYILKAYLKRSGIQLEFATDHDAVLEMVLTKNYNLILVGIPFYFAKEENMIRSIRLLDAYKKVPIIGMTVLPANDATGKRVDADICELMVRPFNPELVLIHYFRLRSNSVAAN